MRGARVVREERKVSERKQARVITATCEGITEEYEEEQ